jgi:hypothetical protein
LYHYAVHLTEAVEVGSIQTTVISLQGSQDVIGADACFLTSGSVNVQLVLREKFKPMEWEDVDNSDAEPEIEQYTK